MVAHITVLFSIHQTIGIRFWQGLNQTPSSIPNTPIIPSAYNLQQDKMSPAVQCPRPLSWPPYIKQDLLGGLLSLFTSLPRTSIFWWWTQPRTSIFWWRTHNQEHPYSGDTDTTKKSCCSNALHHCLSNRFAWNSQVTIGGGKYTICSLNIYYLVTYLICKLKKVKLFSYFYFCSFQCSNLNWAKKYIKEFYCKLATQRCPRKGQSPAWICML